MPNFCGHTHARRTRQSIDALDEGGRHTKEVGILGGTRIARPKPTHQQIAELAYAFWEARGRTGGSAVEDWLRAENELIGRE